MLVSLLLRSLHVLLLSATLATAVTVPPDRRVDCLPAPGASKELCESNSCIWDPTTPADQSAPSCYVPPDIGYQVSGEGTASQQTLVANGKTPYGELLSPLDFATREYGAAYNIRITQQNAKRYEPPIPMPRNAIKSSDHLTLQTFNSPVFSFVVNRASTGVALWNTTIGGFLFADQYIQIATYLPTRRIYGFGENVHLTLMHDLSTYKTWPMFARDEPPVPGEPYNLYGVQPFYMCLEDDGKAHGVLIYNSNAQEVTLGPAPHLIYRTIGGILDITFFPGPSPEEVIQQYTTFVGKPSLPAYFALGFQLSRYGYKDLKEMEDVVTKMQEAKIPLDIPYADIDYMHRYEDFTIGEAWSGFPAYAQKLHEEGLHLFLIFDPAIQIDSAAFINATKAGAKFIEWQNEADVQKETPYPNYNGTYEYVNGTKIMIGVVWPDWYVAFPDFLNSTTIDWWVNEFKMFHERLAIDGIWIDMNEPSVFGTNEKNPWYYNDPDRPVNLEPLYCPQDDNWDNAPYKTHSVYDYGNDSYLCSKTLCMDALTSDGSLFYNFKNLYGITESIATEYALANMTGKRGGIITRSTFVSSGHYGGHWLGDNTSGWKWLQTSIIGTMEFNMFGIPYIGADICGFLGNTTEELCLRWSQLGAFYPFSRNHNGKGSIPQAPAEWISVAYAAREALLFRYHYLPYLYSLMFESSLNGGTVVRPLFFEFPNDAETYQLNYEFMWGSAMVILPVVYEKNTTVHGYLPKDASWYSLRDSDYGQKASGSWEDFSAPYLDMIPVYVRGGYILPRQKPETTTTASRKNPFELLIVPDNGAAGASAKASGTLYWDDGESLITDFQTYNYYQWNFQYTSNNNSATLLITTQHSASNLQIPSLNIIDIIAYPYCADLSQAKLNEQPLSIEPNYIQQGSNRLFVNAQNLINLAQSQDITVSWPHWPSSDTKCCDTENRNNSAVQLKYDLLLAVLFTFVLWML